MLVTPHDFVDVFANYHIIIISEGPCDTEDWNNDVENLTFHHRNKLQFKIHYN